MVLDQRESLCGGGRLTDDANRDPSKTCSTASSHMGWESQMTPTCSEVPFTERAAFRLWKNPSED